MANKAIGHFFGAGAWFDGPVFTNPANGTVLVDTGPFIKGSYLIGIMGASSVPWVYDVEHRNGTNSANVHVQRRRPGSGNDDWNSSNKIDLDTNERIRLLLQGAITGEIQMSIFIQELAT